MAATEIAFGSDAFLLIIQGLGGAASALPTEQLINKAEAFGDRRRTVALMCAIADLKWHLGISLLLVGILKPSCNANNRNFALPKDDESTNTTFETLA